MEPGYSKGLLYCAYAIVGQLYRHCVLVPPWWEGTFSFDELDRLIVKLLCDSGLIKKSHRLNVKFFLCIRPVLADTNLANSQFPNTEYQLWKRWASFFFYSLCMSPPGIELTTSAVFQVLCRTALVYREMMAGVP